MRFYLPDVTYSDTLGIAGKKGNQEWFLALLQSTSGKGFLLSDVEVLSAKTRWDDGGSQYIIHQAKLRELWRFHGIEQVWSRMTSRM